MKLFKNPKPLLIISENEKQTKVKGQLQMQRITKG